MRPKHLAAAALVIAGGLTLTACGGSDDSDNSRGDMPGTSSTPTPSESTTPMADFNDADVSFATDMIPHHRQAVAMATLAETRAEKPAVKDLATRIMNAQDPEIQTMSGWLTSWGRPVPGDMSGMDMSGSMPEMLSNADMDTLMDASGAGFDQMFLTMMIEHHQGAIAMAKTEEADGRSSDAIALAQQIEKAQTDEITTMQGLLK